MKITRFGLLRGPFIDRDQASRREPKIMQNHAKMHPKSPQNEHEKTWIPVSQCPKKTPQRVTCPNATKCVHFCGSRCSFALGKCQKTCKIYTKRVQIRREMSTNKHGFRYRKRKKYTPTCIFSIFPCFSRFGALLMVLWNFVDVSFVIFQLLEEFR